MITTLGKAYMRKSAAMDEDALEHARELLELIRKNRLKKRSRESFRLGTMPETKANEIYSQLGSEYRHSGDAAWALTLDDLRHLNKEHINLATIGSNTPTTISRFVDDLRRLGEAADAGNLASTVTYRHRNSTEEGSMPIGANSPAVWSEDQRHIIHGTTPFAYLNTPINGVFTVRTQYPAGLEYARSKYRSKPKPGVTYIPDHEYRKLDKK